MAVRIGSRTRLRRGSGASARSGRRAGAWACLFAALSAAALCALLLSSSALALGPSPVPERTWVTNGPVYAIAPTQSVTYIGGSFTRVSPRTGPGAGST